jgi:hypothetical protein
VVVDRHVAPGLGRCLGAGLIAAAAAMFWRPYLGSVTAATGSVKRGHTARVHLGQLVPAG